MKNIFLIFCLLLTLTTFGQIDRTEIPLPDEEAFIITIQVQYADNDIYSVILKREELIDEISFTNKCERNNLNRANLLTDNYSYERFLEYLDDINIFSYQPNQNTQDLDTKIRVQFSIIRNRTYSVNAFIIQHNPNIHGEEYQLLEMISEVFQNNATDSCTAELADKFKTHVLGE